MVIRHDSTSCTKSKYCELCDPEAQCTEQDGRACFAMVHAVLLLILYQLLYDSKQEAMVPMDILTFEPQVGLNDKLYICLLDAVR